MEFATDQATIDKTHEGELHEYETWEEALARAGQAAALSLGRPIAGVLYVQAGRRLVSTSLPIRILISMVRRDSSAKKDDPLKHRNRPLTHLHVKSILEYLRTEQKYLMPPVMLNAAFPLQVFTVKTPLATRPCIFILPPDEYLYVTDGQHRLEALKVAIDHIPGLEKDCIGVTIVEEIDINKVHQDFYDAAQVLPLSKALLVEYDGREPLNWISREVAAHATLLKGRVEKIGSVGKYSLLLFTSNQVKNAIVHLLAGNAALYAENMEQQALQRLEAAKDLWRTRIISFLNEFTAHNAQWREVCEKPLATGTAVDIPELRARYIHFSGTGLAVVCGVGHTILTSEDITPQTLTASQREQIKKLALLDWSRNNNLWRGYLVTPAGNIANQRKTTATAIAKIKDYLNIPLTEKEKTLVRY